MAIVDMAWLRGRTLSVIGLAKNAGKTTVLNALLDELYADGSMPSPALTSIGRDGESTDVVTGTGKPGIFLRAGTIAATTSELLRLGDFTREILASTGVYTPMGEVYIVRALSGGAVQLGGPSMTAQLKELKRELFALGADCVLIDGAAGRRSLGAASVADGAILCSGAGLDRSMERVVEQTVFVARLMQLPLHDGAADAIELSGAVTDGVLAELLQRGRELAGRTIVTEDASKLLFSPAAYAKLERLGARMTLRERTRLLAVAVNPVAARGWRFDGGAFRRAVQDRLDVPVINVMEGAL